MVLEFVGLATRGLERDCSKMVERQKMYPHDKINIEGTCQYLRILRKIG